MEGHLFESVQEVREPNPTRTTGEKLENFSEEPAKNPENVTEKPGESTENFTKEPGESPENITEKPAERPKNFTEKPGENPENFTEEPGENPENFTEEPDEIREPFPRNLVRSLNHSTAQQAKEKLGLLLPCHKPHHEPGARSKLQQHSELWQR
ncbi:hypothetical protein DUI87_29025 [Hirundo rustica rustica]|uniref:Uncharacterized protein n=1 Tax=Hirundo rustica rustica TaxID=333673 RepID=A0A3M0J635_HIRRU|nr:hypothetical protein DUI87_29025 [Hirundo rustica rustica]